MNTDASSRIDPERWNACLKLLCQPLHDLDAIQRPAALVFNYNGHVQNGGHSFHFDFEDAAYDDGLIHSLLSMGAREQARILVEARLLNQEVSELDGEEQESLWETIADLDRQFYQARPTIEEVLVKYFNEHRDHFPK